MNKINICLYLNMVRTGEELEKEWKMNAHVYITPNIG